MSDNYFFRTEKLTVGYDGQPLIRDIDIGVEKGQILTLIGPNGSGKSTILKSITKHLAMLAGVVYIDRHDLQTLTNKQAATRLSVVLTERIHPEMMTCGEVVASGRYPYTNHFGRLTVHDKAVVEESLAKVHALDLRERDFGQISDGQRQRIMLARAICQEPEIIVLDEPTSFLDIRHKIELLDILRTMAREKGITVVMSLHEIDLAPKIADVVMCVKGDTIQNYGKPEQIFTEAGIRELYGIENGSYNMRFGSVELSRPVGTAKGFVVAGAGYGASIYRQLQKRQIPFSTGVLFENDIDFEVSRALAAGIVAVPAFMPVTEEARARAEALVLASDWVLDSGAPVGAFNSVNADLLALARRKGIPVFTSVQDMGGVPPVELRKGGISDAV